MEYRIYLFTNIVTIRIYHSYANQFFLLLQNFENVRCSICKRSRQCVRAFACIVLVSIFTFWKRHFVCAARGGWLPSVCGLIFNWVHKANAKAQFTFVTARKCYDYRELQPSHHHRHTYLRIRFFHTTARVTAKARTSYKMDPEHIFIVRGYS